MITPARIEWGDGPPRSADYGDVYHPAAGAIEQARHVFIAGNRLPDRWRDRAAFTIVETGFGLGHNLLATLEAWYADARRCARLHIVSIEKHPLRRDDLDRALAPLARTPDAAETLRREALELVAQWPPLTAGLHRMRFGGGAVTLDLFLADVHDALRELVCTADAFFLDGFAPALNPAMWDARVFRAISRLAAGDATAATWSVARPVRDGLGTAGFDVRIAPGFGGKRDMLTAQRRPLPEGRRRHDVLARLGTRLDVTRAEARLDDAFVIGAGLAGAHVAAALGARGLRCTVLDRHPEPAEEASAGIAGIFHGTVHAIDSVHARLHRAAALVAARSHRALLDGKTLVPGAVDGLLRLSEMPLEGMRARIDDQDLPPDWVQALDATTSSRLAGVSVSQPCWFFPHAGWVSPQALVRCLLRSATSVRFAGSADVARIERIDDVWHAFAPDGAALARARICVLAQAMPAAALAPWARWPLHTSRGQSTWLSAGTPGLNAPRVPISSNGYAIGLPDGSVLCGASADRDDTQAEARDNDTRDNLDKLARLTGSATHVMDAHALENRVAWRCRTSDRMPIAGAVPARVIAASIRHTQPRHIAREPGLYVLTALGSRGLTLAPLLADVVAASILREPMPIEASLLDAIDPARFVVASA